MSYDCKLIADSHTIEGEGIPAHRLTTLEVTLPRIVLAEFNTHRMLSRNSASSRAIPVEKQIARVMEDPFVPIYWGKNQKGMQADEELTPEEQQEAVDYWTTASDFAVVHAKKLIRVGVHKQITNRLLEPWMWQTIICSGTDFDNFFALRCHKDAQPEIRKAAEMMREVRDASTPRTLLPGEWHLPMVIEEEIREEKIAEVTRWQASKEGKKEGMHRLEYPVRLAKISAGRCGRVSYLTHGKRDPESDLKFCEERLIAPGHMSPLEHPARAFTVEEREAARSAHTWFRKQVEHGIIQLALALSQATPGPHTRDVADPARWAELARGVWYCGNFAGFRQFRKMIPGENVFTGGSSS